MRPFLGRVPLRIPGSRSLGQVEFTDPWGGFHRIAVEPAPVPEEIPPFNAPFSEESRLRDQREESYRRKIEAKRQECDFLDRNADDYKEYYEGLENPEDEDYQAYSHAVDAYNECVDQIDALQNEMNTAPIDFGVTPQSPNGPEWPPEVPKPTGPIHGPTEPPEVPSVDWRIPSTPPHELNQWPEEVPYPTGEPVPPPVPPELVETPPPVASTDWRFEGCPPGTQRLVRGGMCVSSGVASTAMTPTGSVMGPAFTMGRAMLGQVRLMRRPGAF